MNVIAIRRDSTASMPCHSDDRKPSNEGLDIMEAMILGSVGATVFTSLVLAQISTSQGDIAFYNSLIGGSLGMLVGLCHYKSSDYLDLAKQALSSVALAAFTGRYAHNAAAWAFPNLVSADAPTQVFIAGVIGYGGSSILKRVWPKIEDRFVSQAEKKIEDCDFNEGIGRGNGDK